MSEFLTKDYGFRLDLDLDESGVFIVFDLAVEERGDT